MHKTLSDDMPKMNDIVLACLMRPHLPSIRNATVRCHRKLTVDFSAHANMIHRRKFIRRSMKMSVSQKSFHSKSVDSRILKAKEMRACVRIRFELLEYGQCTLVLILEEIIHVSTFHTAGHYSRWLSLLQSVKRIKLLISVWSKNKNNKFVLARPVAY